ncbi:hypothetical protein LSH36_108g04012 [Paralvinella palmiformis]|uniref:Uncharacterized protein n=1 Tax=Paralvinella palmiformis TaxID=53620 RepID=A0AAD9K0Z1_9ANNE|nr:hypothetical protein LSH36_108g04012 [Paralvinella palmiformis]
MNKDVMTK